jgi:hypothetical protein
MTDAGFKGVDKWAKRRVVLLERSRFFKAIHAEIFKQVGAELQTPSCERPKLLSEPCFYYFKTRIVCKHGINIGLNHSFHMILFYETRYCWSSPITEKMVRIGYGLINIIDSKAKCRHLKQLTCKGTARQVFICLRLPFLLGFCLGWCSNFVGFKSGQTQSAYLLQNMVSNGTQHPHPIPTTHCTLTQERGGEGEELNQREGLDEQQFTKLGRRTNMTDCISSL